MNDKNHNIKIIFGIFAVVTFSIIIIVSLGIMLEKPAWISWGWTAVVYVMAIIILLVGLVGINHSRKSRGKNDSRKEVVFGTIVDYEKKLYSRRVYYYPVYEYYINGRRETIVSTVGTRPARGSIGDKAQLMYNHDTGKAVCLGEKNVHSKMYIVFVVIGVALLAWAIYRSVGMFL